MSDDSATPHERIAVALERIAEQLDTPPALASRVATLEELLRDVVQTIEKPDSTNEDWVELLEHLRGALP